MPTNPINTAGIVGTDGMSPIYDPANKFKIYALKEIYLGEIGENKYVPNPGDYVVDTDLFIWYEVTSVDPGTLIPSLVVKRSNLDSGEFTEEEILLGVGPGIPNDTFRVYIDRSVTPHTLTVDQNLTINGSMTSHAKIFKGNDLSTETNVISLFYDNGGSLMGTSIPLEIVSQVPDGQVNYSIKTVPTCYTNRSLTDGDVVTVVFYSAAGHVVSKRQLLVENTAFIKRNNIGVRYVTGISLESPFLSQTNPKLINLPVNVLMEGINMRGVVHYSDGTVNKYPVDGTRFSVIGLNHFLPSIVSQNVPIVLRYRLGVNESAYNITVGEDRFITETYNIRTTVVDGAYSVKLFVYPVWRNVIEGYTLRWYLYNGDRDVVYDVTGMIEYSSAVPAFNPTAYGVSQRLAVAIDLSNVSGTYTNYRHVQSVDLVLWNQGTERSTNWTIAYEQNQNPVYGIDNHAKMTFINTNLYRLNISLDETDFDEWIDRIYYRTKPLIDPTRELNAPLPTHFVIKVLGQVFEFPISQWNQELTIGSSGINNNDTLFIEFIRKTPDTDLYLGVSGIPIYQNT